MKKVLLAAAGIILIFTTFLFISQQKSEFPNAKELPNVTLFYGEGCPHCINLEKYFKQNRIEERFKFQKKEVFNNKSNARELVDIASKSGLDTETIGVPFLWDGSKTYLGEPPIREYFDNLLKQ